MKKNSSFLIALTIEEADAVIEAAQCGFTDLDEEGETHTVKVVEAVIDRLMERINEARNA